MIGSRGYINEKCNASGINTVEEEKELQMNVPLPLHKRTEFETES